jgi:hypothetical protein
MPLGGVCVAGGGGGCPSLRLRSALRLHTLLMFGQSASLAFALSSPSDNATNVTQSVSLHLVGEVACKITALDGAGNAASRWSDPVPVVAGTVNATQVRFVCAWITQSYYCLPSIGLIPSRALANHPLHIPLVIGVAGTQRRQH